MSRQFMFGYVDTSQFLPTMPAVRTLYSQSTAKAGDLLSAPTIGTTETAYASGFTLPADSLVAGQIIRVWAAGRFTCSAITAPTQRLRLKLGSVTLLDSTALSLLLGASNNRWWLDARIIVRSIGASGTAECYGRLDYASGLTGVLTTLLGPGGSQSETANPVTIDTTASVALGLTAQFSANTAGNSNEMRQLIIDTAPPSASSN